MFSNVNAFWEVVSSHGFSLIFRVFPASFTLALRQEKLLLFMFFYLYPWSFVTMPFFFLFVFYTFKKNACDESAERSQGDKPTRREKNKSLPNWVSSFTQVCFFLLTFWREILSGFDFGTRSSGKAGNVIYSTAEMRALFVFPRLVVTMEESEPQMKVQVPNCVTKGTCMILSQGLFTRRFGTSARWGNPLRWGNPAVCI